MDYAWLLDPEARSIEVFRRAGEGWELVGTWSAEDRVRAEPFDAIELELGKLWPGQP